MTPRPAPCCGRCGDSKDQRHRPDRPWGDYGTADSGMKTDSLPQRAAGKTIKGFIRNPMESCSVVATWRTCAAQKFKSRTNSPHGCRGGPRVNPSSMHEHCSNTPVRCRTARPGLDGSARDRHPHSALWWRVPGWAHREQIRSGTCWRWAGTTACCATISWTRGKPADPPTTSRLEDWFPTYEQDATDLRPGATARFVRAIAMAHWYPAQSGDTHRFASSLASAGWPTMRAGAAMASRLFERKFAIHAVNRGEERCSSTRSPRTPPCWKIARNAGATVKFGRQRDPRRTCTAARGWIRAWRAREHFDRGRLLSSRTGARSSGPVWPAAGNPPGRARDLAPPGGRVTARRPAALPSGDPLSWGLSTPGACPAPAATCPDPTLRERLKAEDKRTLLQKVAEFIHPGA